MTAAINIIVAIFLILLIAYGIYLVMSHKLKFLVFLGYIAAGAIILYLITKYMTPVDMRLGDKIPDRELDSMINYSWKYGHTGDTSQSTEGWTIEKYEKIAHNTLDVFNHTTTPYKVIYVCDTSMRMHYIREMYGEDIFYEYKMPFFLTEGQTQEFFDEVRSSIMDAALYLNAMTAKKVIIERKKSKQKI